MWEKPTGYKNIKTDMQYPIKLVPGLRIDFHKNMDPYNPSIQKDHIFFMLYPKRPDKKETISGDYLQQFNGN